ncbi:putative eukaryotic-type primase small subunit family protein [Lyophyllum shimeji]|uniref:DNA primase n=1 Tax=Lyophyllum shimeji TaxID=47721 RepID=A0A9P3PL15_LYOSH|nr:putative eukaryotic-type primase small subunit family protein [Lyophyllum shimeji]
MAVAEAVDTSPEVMLTFYRRLYPFKSIFNWLNHEHAPTRLFTHREFAFTLQGDVYLRYQCFRTAEELKKQVCQLNPTRFEIGPVYSFRPKDKKTAPPGAFNPVQRELVFDIDMTDYDPVRTCCSGADICRRCWAFISAAVQVLHVSIREQFGYEHLLWVYSGRRGIHLWISDKEAMELTDDQRKALVSWMTVIQGSPESSKKLNVRLNNRSLPPSLQTALEHLATIFSELVLADQNVFESQQGFESLLQQIPDLNVVKALRETWSEDPSRSSEAKWADLKSQARAYAKGSTQRINLTSAMEDIILHHTYPRIDAEVSKHRNHLLKAPFCVHPKTGRVCVPVDPERIEEFDPEKVPTVNQLLKELDSVARSEGEIGEHHSDWERTSLKPYIDMLDKHALRLMEQVRRDKRGRDVSW